MFQRTFHDVNISSNYDLEFIEDNLAKIVKSYRNTSETTKFKQNSIIESIKNLLNDNEFEEEVVLSEYLSEIKNKYLDSKLEEEVIYVKEVEEEKVYNIEDILKSSEQEIFNTKDQKGLLKNLIDDININTNNNISYDDEKFMNNMQEIINESLNEDNIVKQEENNNEVRMKKSKSPFIFVLLLVVFLSTSGYIFKDKIISLLNLFN